LLPFGKQNWFRPWVYVGLFCRIALAFTNRFVIFIFLSCHVALIVLDERNFRGIFKKFNLLAEQISLKRILIKSNTTHT